MDNDSYVISNAKKIQKYITNGFSMNSDLLLVYGSNRELPDPQGLRKNLEALLNHIADTMYN